MSLKLALQLFNHQNVNTLLSFSRKYPERYPAKDIEPLVRFMRMTIQLHKLFSLRSKRDGLYHQVGGRRLQQLEECRVYFEEEIEGSDLLTSETRSAIIQTIYSLKRYVENRIKAKKGPVKTSHLNQNKLENSFGCHRSRAGCRDV